MRIGSLLLLLSACSTTEPSGHPLTPVQPATSASASNTQPAPADDFKISSEELQANAAATDRLPASPFGDDGGGDVATSTPVTPAVPPTTPSVDDAAADQPPPAAPTPAPAPAPAPAPTAAQPASWPVRLVKTVADAQPPRAILSLPDGREVVVTPGDLLADQGLVVMAIGRSTIDLASVKGVGDHAEVASTTLIAQY